MARMPGAAWHPLGDNPLHQPLMSGYRGIILHTAVGSLYSTDGYFMHGNGEGYIGTESHFIIGAFGEIWQITDTARTADANLEGNPWYLSIETADSGEGFPAWSGENVPPWRPEQVTSLARVCSWASTEHKFPLQRMPNSLPSSEGVGYHRLGIDSVPPGRPGWRVSGGLSYTTSPGKICPSDERIAQVDDVIDLAKTAAKPPWPQFRETSPAVRAMVAKLDAGGYFTGVRRDDPGYYGTFTRGAIERLQLAFDDTKADPDGLIGALTWAHIEAIPDPPQEPPVDPPGKPLAAAWQKTGGDTVRSLGADVTAGQAYVDAHPNQKLIAALHGEDVEALHAAQIRWQRKHQLATP